MINDTQLIADNIKRHRCALKMTQAELAERLGYSEKAISKWECGQGVPPTLILPRLAGCLEISIDMLLCGELPERLYLGIDGGGTKTEFALADEGGNIIRRAVLGASNPNDVGITTTCEILRAGISEVCGEYQKNRISVYAGIAGGSSEENRRHIQDLLSRSGFAEVRSGNDAQNAVAASLGDKNGITVIMGTGSIAYAKQDGALYRIGGYGYLFGDEGSGFSLGRDAILAALSLEDGSGDDTSLLGYVKQNCRCTAVLEALDGFYRGGKRCLASFAPLVFRAYSEGDAVAERILTQNIGAIARLVRGAMKHVKDEKITVSLCGGLTAYAEHILPLLKDTLKDAEHRLDIRICERPVIWGALMLAGMKPQKGEEKC